MNTVKIDSKNTLMIAHRGVSGIETENTLAAFIAAGNRSHYGIETDVHRTSDGKFVVIHDDVTDRVSPAKLSVEGSDYETLRSVPLNAPDGDGRRADMRIPSLKEYIDTCRRYEKTAVLELKNEFCAEDIKRICDEINAENYLDNVIFISFCFDNLVRIRSLYPEQPVQFLTDDYTDNLPALLSEHKMDLDIRYTELDAEKIDILHRCGIKVNCWTCDSPEEAERLAGWGIDFITSNILE